MAPLTVKKSYAGRMVTVTQSTVRDGCKGDSCKVTVNTTVNNTGTTKDIPVIEMAEKIRCSPDTVSGSLPENWNELQKKALDEFSNFFNKMQTGREQKKVTKEAIEIVKKYIEKGDN